MIMIKLHAGFSNNFQFFIWYINLVEETHDVLEIDGGTFAETVDTISFRILVELQFVLYSLKFSCPCTVSVDEINIFFRFPPECELEDTLVVVWSVTRVLEAPKMVNLGYFLPDVVLLIVV